MADAISESFEMNHALFEKTETIKQTNGILKIH